MIICYYSVIDNGGAPKSRLESILQINGSGWDRRQISKHRACLVLRAGI